jgi:hypothetical protein
MNLFSFCFTHVHVHLQSTLTPSYQPVTMYTREDPDYLKAYSVLASRAYHWRCPPSGPTSASLNSTLVTATLASISISEDIEAVSSAENDPDMWQ